MMPICVFQFVGLFNIGSSENLESSDANVVAKRRKICTGEVDGECPSSIESKDTAASSVDSSGNSVVNMT